MKKYSPLKNLGHDLPSGLVVFLVALPLCLGIALASGAPLFSGIISGVIGGLIIGSLSGSQLSVCGPAAGLTTIVIASVIKLETWEAFLCAVVLAGVIQLVMGFLKAGSIGNYFPSSVIKGMLAAIGLILILKQIPHAVGFDADYEGDDSFLQPDGQNTLTEINRALDAISPGAVIIAAVALTLLILWERPFIKKQKFTLYLPGPLLAVVFGTLLNEFFKLSYPELAVSSEHLVSLPVSSNIASFISQFTFPDFGTIANFKVFEVAFTIALVASLETLLSIEASDQLDPLRRVTPLNRELKAQGVGNIISGLIGGLPITSVIVRSSANVNSGARTKASTMFHGFLLLSTVAFIPGILNTIPLSCLAAILITVGYKLTKPATIKAMYLKGWNQFLPFIITIIAILLTDLLIGISIGIVIGLLFVLKTNFQKSLFSVSKEGNYLIRLTKDVSFLNKALLRQTFRDVPDNSHVIIDGSRSYFIDPDILETIEDFQKNASIRNITVELNKSISASNHFFKL